MGHDGLGDKQGLGNKGTPGGRWIVALTGASGMRYGLRLIDAVVDVVQELHIVFSDAGLRVLAEEEDRKLSHGALSDEVILGRRANNIHFHRPRDIGASIASGSAVFDGMVVCPCSMNTLASIAHGLASNLVARAADVTLKEGRRLILVPRETPMSQIHLENLLRLARMGSRIVPAMPGFYHAPRSIEDLVDMMVMKIVDQMGIENEISRRWNPDRSKERFVGAGSESLVLEMKNDG